MASIRALQKVGDTMLVRFGDGTSQFAYPTPTGEMWLPGGGDVTPPDPDPDPEPEPGGKWAWPFKPGEWPAGEVTPGRDYTPPNHWGIDFGYGAAQDGAPIKCASPTAVVKYVGVDQGSWFGTGNMVTLNHGVYDGKTIYTHHFHMRAPSHLRVGDKVKRGDVLGYVGNTGNSFGSHLHWQMHAGTATEPGLFETCIDPNVFMRGKT